MRNFTIILFLFVTSLMSAQEVIGAATMHDGNTVDLYDGANAKKNILLKGSSVNPFLVSFFGPMTWDTTYFFYYDNGGKIEELKIKDLKSVSLADGQIKFLTKPIKKKRYRLMRLIAHNDQYELFNLMSNGPHFYIYDQNGEMVEEYVQHGTTKKKSEKAIGIVEQYFADCTELMDALKTNIQYPNKINYMAKQYNLLFHVGEEGGQSTAKNFVKLVDCKSN